MYYLAMDQVWTKYQRKLNPRELLTVVGGVVLFGVVGVTGFKAVTTDHKFSKAQKDIETLKMAVMSYWSHHQLVFPKDVERSLASAKPQVLREIPKDPWSTDSKTSGYGFIQGSEPSIGQYFIVYTQGPEKDTQPRLNAASQVIEYSGSGIVVSNLPTKKIN
ncbi:MAG: hypothetical protein EBR01_10845 [Proteobacteria bacterium]|nr:hypothetical protein [Pseudomonadota bacterium]NBY19259.1 hypothetical protein [bacterium]